MPRIINIASLLVLIFASAAVRCHADDGSEREGMLVGNYRLIGQLPDSGKTYSGKVSISRNGPTLKFIRTIDGVTAKGTAIIDEVTADDIPVLQAKFMMNGKEYAATYLWRGDLDNYARFTGYIYFPKTVTPSPGLEALFAIPPTPEK